MNDEEISIDVMTKEIKPEMSVEAKIDDEINEEEISEQTYKDPFDISYCTEINNKCGGTVIKPSEFIKKEKLDKEEINEIEPNFTWNEGSERKGN